MVQRSGVLIETYWNVKDFDEKNCVDLSLSINRNILECKDIASQNTAKSQESINRNILECKGITQLAGITSSIRY